MIKEEVLEVDFQGKRLLMFDVGAGPLFTEEQYMVGAPSYCHLFADGRVLRFGNNIGSWSDICVVGKKAISQPPEDIRAAVACRVEVYENILGPMMKGQ